MARGFTLKDEKLEALQDDIRAAIVTGEARSHIPRSKTVELSGMSVTAFYKAWKQPELFRVRQLYDIYQGLRIPEEARRYV